MVPKQAQVLHNQLPQSTTDHKRISTNKGRAEHLIQTNLSPEQAANSPQLAGMFRINPETIQEDVHTRYTWQKLMADPAQP